MILYRLSSLYNRVSMFEDFETLIWTDRYSSYGDFQVTCAVNSKTLEFFSINTNYASSESDSVMRVEYVEVKDNSEGVPKLTVRGRSLVKVLEDRVVEPKSAGSEELNISLPQGFAAHALVKFYCEDGLSSPDDVIPNFESYYSNLGDGTGRISIKPQSVYEAVKSLCDSADLGFKIALRPNDLPRLRFLVYQGTLRSDVVFGSALDNLTDEALLHTNEELKNVAYIWTEGFRQRRTVVRKGLAIPSGLNRKVMFIHASDVNPDDYDLDGVTRVLTQRAHEEFSKQREKFLFDGTMVSGNYTYGTDYSLGDQVIVQARDGDRHVARVIEHIWSVDETGSTSYPTFSDIEY